jgi:hypothetical protein
MAESAIRRRITVVGKIEMCGWGARRKKQGIIYTQDGLELSLVESTSRLKFFMEAHGKYKWACALLVAASNAEENSQSITRNK